MRTLHWPILSCLTFTILSIFVGSASAETLATCGQGWLEEINGQMVLHLKGTPYEMGY